MSELLVVLGLAALPAAANLIGGLAAEVRRLRAPAEPRAPPRGRDRARRRRRGLRRPGAPRASLGFLALREAPEIVTLTVLALTGGVLTTVVVEELVAEAHEGDTSELGPVFLTAGVAVFGAVSVYVGG